MTSYCLVHGAWHDATCWDPVTEALRAAGHDVVAPDLPFDDPATTFDARIEPALRAIDGLADPLVVVGHSMGAGYAPSVAAHRQRAVLVHLCPGLGPLRDGFPVTEPVELEEHLGVRGDDVLDRLAGKRR